MISEPLNLIPKPWFPSLFQKKIMFVVFITFVFVAVSLHVRLLPHPSCSFIFPTVYSSSLLSSLPYARLPYLMLVFLAVVKSPSAHLHPDRVPTLPLTPSSSSRDPVISVFVASYSSLPRIRIRLVHCSQR